MSTINLEGKTYEVDSLGFLVRFEDWDEKFAVGLAPQVGIKNGLTPEHWAIIHFIRESYEKYGKCPLVYQVCRLNGLHLSELEAYFPSGYLRGACRLAGVTYREGFCGQNAHVEERQTDQDPGREKVYTVDARGFLVDPFLWDEQFAICKAAELKMPSGLTERHWQVLHSLRRAYRLTHRVPTVYDACREYELTIEELERLFPDGYHRGAVKLAGLRVR